MADLDLALKGLPPRRNINTADGYAYWAYADRLLCDVEHAERDHGWGRLVDELRDRLGPDGRDLLFAIDDAHGLAVADGEDRGIRVGAFLGDPPEAC